jgi:hypothetical protein
MRDNSTQDDRSFGKPPEEDDLEYFGRAIEMRPANFAPAFSEHGPVFLAEYRQSGPVPATFTMTARCGDMSREIQEDLREMLSTVQMGHALLDPRRGLTDEEVSQLDRSELSEPSESELEVIFELAWKKDPGDGLTPWAFKVDPITRTIYGRAARHRYRTLTGGAVRCRIWVEKGQAALHAAGYGAAAAPPNYSGDRSGRDFYVSGLTSTSTYTIYGLVRSM